MAVITIPTDEILALAQEIREDGLALSRKTERLWMMSKPTIKIEDATDQKADGAEN